MCSIVYGFATCMFYACVYMVSKLIKSLNAWFLWTDRLLLCDYDEWGYLGVSSDFIMW